jgi:hypothetical protein
MYDERCSCEILIYIHSMTWHHTPEDGTLRSYIRKMSVDPMRQGMSVKFEFLTVQLLKIQVLWEAGEQFLSF